MQERRKWYGFAKNMEYKTHLRYVISLEIKITILAPKTNLEIRQNVTYDGLALTPRSKMYQLIFVFSTIIQDFCVDLV